MPADLFSDPSPAPVSGRSAEPTVVYTDGACSGNPGPGGWAWAVPEGPIGSGGDPQTTNNRMELQAVLEALRALPHPLHVITDSTYVKNGIMQWRHAWQRNGWKTKARQDVKNRDLWEQISEAVDNGEVTFGWVKGHSGDRMNDLVDELAVVERDRFKAGARPGTSNGAAVGGPVPHASPAQSDNDERAMRRRRDGRIPEGHLLAVFGVGPADLGGYDENPVAAALRRKLAEIFAAKLQLHSDLVVFTGLRLGTESVAAEAAIEAGVPFVGVLPWPDPNKTWPRAARERFAAVTAQARSLVTLEKKTPIDKKGFAASLKRRDAWIRLAGDEAILVAGEDHRNFGDLRKALEKKFGDDLWIVDPAGLS